MVKKKTKTKTFAYAQNCVNNPLVESYVQLLHISPPKKGSVTIMLTCTQLGPLLLLLLPSSDPFHDACRNAKHTLKRAQLQRLCWTCWVWVCHELVCFEHTLVHDCFCIDLHVRSLCVQLCVCVLRMCGWTSKDYWRVRRTRLHADRLPLMNNNLQQCKTNPLIMTRSWATFQHDSPRACFV